MRSDQDRTSARGSKVAVAEAAPATRPAARPRRALPTWLPRSRQQWLLFAMEHAPFLFSFCAAAYLLTINFIVPWAGMHEDNGLLYSSAAVNYFRYGLGMGKGQLIVDHETSNKLLPKSIPGVPASQLYHYLFTGPVHPFLYPDHPPFLSLTIALSYLMFGFSFWAARLVPILYALGSVLVFYLIMRQVFTRRREKNRLIIWLSTFLYGIFPMMAYFGRNVDQESPVMFYALLMLLGYFIWLRDPRRRWVALMAFSVVMGVMYDWPMCYFACILFASHWIATRRFSRALLLGTVVPAVGTFLVALAQIAWSLDGNLAKIEFVFLERTGSSVVYSYTLSEYLDRVVTYNRQAFTVWTQLLMLPALAFLVWRIREEGWSRRVAFVCLSLCFGLSHMIIFHQAVYFHIYWQIYLLPFYGSVFGWSIAWVIQRIVRKPVLATVAVVAVAALAFRLFWPYTNWLYMSAGQSVPITHYLLNLLK